MLLTGLEAQARAALDAVHEQPDPRLEILTVVMDGRLQPLADGAVRGDWRARQLVVDRDDAAHARRAGSAAARAPWLVFVSPRHLLLPGAVANLLAARGAAGTPVLGELEGSASPWSRTPLLGRLLVPRESWRDAPDDGEPDGQTAAVWLLAGGFTGTGHATLRDVFSPRARLFEKVEDPTPALPARVVADRSMLAALQGDDALRAERAVGALARDLPQFLLAVERCDDDQWELLRSHAAVLVEATGDRGWSDVPVEDKVAGWLAAAGRREALVEFVAARRFARGSFPTSVRDGSVVAELAGAPDDVPLEALRVHEDESSLRVQVRRMRLQDDELLLELFAGLRRVHQGVECPEVSARLLMGDEPLALSAEVSVDPAVTRWMGEPHQSHDCGVVSLRVPLSALSFGSWPLELEMQQGGVRRTGRVAELDRHGSAARPLVAGGRSLRWSASGTELQLVIRDGQPKAAPGRAVVRSCHLAPGRVVLEVDLPTGASAALVAPGEVVTGVRDGDRWVFDLVVDPWGLGPTPAPTGAYRLAVTVDGAEVPVTLAGPVDEQVPFSDLDELHRRSVWRGPRGGFVLRLDPPLTDEEAGPYRQHELQRSCLAVTEPLDPGLVYFQSFLGHAPTDHPAAIQAELHRTLQERSRSGVRMLWAVADSAARVPEGAEPVLLRSREWYDALARAKWIVANIELEPWFVRREGQEVLETYHGYPSKVMGLAQWRARGLTPTHVERMLRRTSGSWNTLLTPIPEMDRYYRENYEFQGRIISVGYPRNDALVGPGHESRRTAARERLGIAAHQKAVLYAPTWRDDLATNFRRAQAVHHLDVEEAASALGPDYVVLLRGHRFHSPGGAASRVVDVTTYPEINDLVLAADAAVLDYSSLRFDFALTGRPMVFLVPDLEEYSRQVRGFLYPFEESAPGPMVATTAEVVAALHDLPGLQRSWATEIERFNAHYNRLNDGRAAQRVVAEFFDDLLGDA